MSDQRAADASLGSGSRLRRSPTGRLLMVDRGLLGEMREDSRDDIDWTNLRWQCFFTPLRDPLTIGQKTVR